MSDEGLRLAVNAVREKSVRHHLPETIPPGGSAKWFRTLFSRTVLAKPGSLFCLVAALLIGGCGGRSDLGEVSGTVTLEGEPLANARIVFQPQSQGSASFGMTDEQGKYTLQYSDEDMGAAIGTHTVSISTFVVPDPDADEPAEAREERVPAKYNVDSELTAEVTAGSNTINFELEAGELPDWRAADEGEDGM
jgi:hypothetical protein